MRHGKKINHLGRKSAHRHALLSNMATSLILHKRITTTVAKAKALRKYVEPLLTKAKNDTTHSRRTVFAYLQDKESIKTLFGEIAGRIATRAGGYTRIIKLGDARLGDAADMCMMELVDFNDIYKKDGAEKKAKTRRGRKGNLPAGRQGKEEGVEDAEVVSEAKEEKPKKAAKKTKKEE
jgi:large subunit ribosomal protein L17